ncbi:zinc finger BED domain-containing protein 4-like [Rhizophagus irregularis DAOM 181602=DAOM 197198]|nr:zinc finger BED domain-containing protein 4-like [Rhizophagus irregularis DAOM 181602=DAOM 197198]
MVKKKGTVWKHWTIITEAESNEESSRSKKKTHPSVRCNYCSKVFEQGTAKRMQVHLNDSCPRAPESAKTKKQQIPELLETSDATTSTFIPTVKTSKKHLKNTTIENFVDPFKLPNRRKLADELLDDVFDEVKAECNEQILQAKSLTMVSDGWSNINRESVQNFVICTPKPLFFDAIYSGEESHTAKWVADEIIKQMEIVGINKFSAVITDTASVMKAAWGIIEDSYPSIVCLGCNSHVMNLLISDILKIDQIKSVVENAKKLVNYFKAHVQATAKLKRIQKENYSKEIALVLPALTRWGTHLACFQSLQNSRTALEQALMDIRIRQNMDLTLRAHILSDEFWEDLDIITKIMEPMVSALKLFESDISILSNVYSYFKEVMNQINQIDCNFSDKLQELIAKRWEYTYHPIMITAYMLDPQFLEKSKNDEVESIGYVEFTTFVNKRFNQEEAVELFAELVNFRNKNSPYDNEIIWKSANILNSSLWWQSWPTSKLQQLAIKILSIPTSSAAAERNFSTFVYIYGNLRMCNRLVKIQKKKQISNFNENEEDSNNSSDNENKEDDNNNSSDNDSIFGFEANVINLDDEE